MVAFLPKTKYGLVMQRLRRENFQSLLKWLLTEIKRLNFEIFMCQTGCKWSKLFVLAHL